MAILPRGQLSLPFGCDETKRCTKCGAEKPLDDYYVKDKKTGRLISWCKVCHNRITGEASKAKYAADPETFKSKSRAFRAANLEKIKERQRKSQRENRPKFRERERAYKKANREKIKAKKDRYRKRRGHVIAAWNAQHYAANREKMLEYHKRWRDANSEQHRETLNASKNRRRARLSGAGGTHTPAEWRALKAFYSFTCLMCGQSEPAIKLTKDHVIPIALGGTDDITNIQPLCKSCNSHKHAKHIDLRSSV